MINKICLLLIACLLPLGVFAKNLKIDNSNSVWLDTEVNAASVDKAIQKIDSLCKDKFRIYLIINTNGGSIDEGMRLIKHMEYASCKVDTVAIKAISMGFTIHQMGEKRYMVKNGTLMQHHPLTYLEGFYNPNDLEQIYDELLKVYVETLKLFAPRSGHTVEEMAKLIGAIHWWKAIDAVKDRLVDDVVTLNGK